MEKTPKIIYDGWSLWWFFKLRFLENKLPKIFFKSEKIALYNEQIKWLLSSKKTKKPQDDKKRIMFMVHTNAILPDKTIDRIESVIKEVRKSPEFEEYISVVSPLSHKNYLQISKQTNLIYSYIDEKIKQKAREASKRLHEEWKELKDKSKHHEFFFSKEMLYLTILYYETYKKIIQEECINLLCVYADTGILSKCAIAAAHRSGINTLHIWHGTEIPSVNPDQPDTVYHVTIGEKYKEEYIKLGVPKENVFVTGPVFLDSIIHYLNKKYYGKKHKKQILLATSCWLEDNRGDEEIYTKFITNLSKHIYMWDAQLIIKMHPREQSEKLYSFISQKYKNIEIIKDKTKDTLYNLIGQSDVVVGFGSTINTEAMIMGKPSLFIDFEQFHLKDFILGDERVLRVSPENVPLILLKILTDVKFKKKTINKQNEVIKDYLYKIDGNAGKRIFEIIKKLS